MKAEEACCPHPDTFRSCHGCDKPQIPYADHDRHDPSLTAQTDRLHPLLHLYIPTSTLSQSTVQCVEIPGVYLD